MSYLAIARAAESRMKAERDPGAILAEAYKRYWNTPETVPMETFQALHREIDLIEKQVGVEVAWHTLEASARSWYKAKGTCPFCGKNELHLSGR